LLKPIWQATPFALQLFLEKLYLNRGLMLVRKPLSLGSVSSFSLKPFLEKGLSQSTVARPSYTITPRWLEGDSYRLLS